MKEVKKKVSWDKKMLRIFLRSIFFFWMAEIKPALQYSRFTV
jgi:hypothetical protein